jgi:hypothetical protein
MAMSNEEIQREWRERMKADGYKRINTWIDASYLNMLNITARHLGENQYTTLERAIKAYCAREARQHPELAKLLQG